MSHLLHHLLLALAVLALAQAGMRIATAAGAGGMARFVAAVVLGVGIAVVQALALGLVGLGSSPLALSLAALATWAALAARLPDDSPAGSPGGEPAAWWRELSRAGRLAAAAGAGLCVAWLVWQLREPSIGFDSSLYHYPFVAGWIENGSPGSELELSYDIPYNSYPLTDEVALTWGAAIARSWVPLSLWNPLMLVMLAAGVWLTLRNLSVARVPAGLAVGVLVTQPLIVKQLNEPQTDLPALAWVACCAGLATAAGRRPALLAPALVAAGLAVGTKPSTGPMALAAVCIGAYLARERLRPLAGWLALGLAGALAVGSFWYLRNIVEHGSPLWPFMRGPWGDPQPRFLGLLEVSFLERPSATLGGRVGEYAERVGGAGLVVVGALFALLAGLLGRRSGHPVHRQLLVSGGLAALGVLIWSTAWGTGLPTAPELEYAAGFSLSALRYLLPAMGAAAVSVAIASGAGRRAGVAATALLAVAVAANLVLDARLGEPWTPPLWVPVVGALAGVAALGAAMLPARALRARGAHMPRLAGVSAAAVAGALVTGALVSLAADGFLERYTERPNTSAYGPELVSWFLDQPFFEDDDLSIAIASRGVVAQLAGDRFDNRLVLVPQRASCAEVERLARRMPVVVTPQRFAQGFLGLEPYTAPRCLARHEPVLDRDPFYVYRLPRRVASAP